MPSTDAIEPGRILGGYQLEKQVARGGMGAVFRARHVELERVVALKILKPELTSNPQIIRRFLREGKLIARLEHESIIKVFDLGEEDGCYFLVMEYLRGRDLLKILSQDGPIPPRKALRIGRRVAAALSYAHEQGIIHRDVKPSNIFLCDDGSVRLMDFGIARLQEQDTLLTNPGAFLGTPVYMSPEQCRGQNVDARSDLYSLGATLYHVITGKPPFEGKSPAALMGQILNRNPRPIETLTPGMSEQHALLIKRLMAKHPGARFQTGRELMRAIGDALENRYRGSGEVFDTGEAEALEDGTHWRTIVFGTLVVALCAVVLFVARLHDVPDTTAHAEFGPPVPSAANSSTAPDDTSTAVESAVEDEDRRPPRERFVERLDGFQKVLLAGQAEETLAYLSPPLRRQPTLLLSLGRVLQQIQALRRPVEVEREISIDESQADVIFVFRQTGSTRYLQFPLTWRYEAGNWYIRPRPAQK